MRGPGSGAQSDMSQQKTVGPTASRSEVEYDGEDKQKEEDTANLLYTYVFSRSSTDTTLTSDQVETFQSVSRDVGSSDGAAIEVGRRLAQLGK